VAVDGAADQGERETDDGNDWEDTGAALAGANGTLDIELDGLREAGEGNDGAPQEAGGRGHSQGALQEARPRGVNKWDRTYARMLHQVRGPVEPSELTS
jgi:hypothetical protein